VAIGSRDAERARARAVEIGSGVEGGDNGWAARASDVVLLSVPYGGHAETLRALKQDLEGKVLIDITVPLRPPRVHEVNLPPGQAAALEAQAILGPGVKVVAALHHVSSVHLSDPDAEIDCDVLVATDDDAARATVMSLVKDLGCRALDAGPLKNAVALEALTPVLLHLNKRYKTAGAGVRFAGIDPK
jgi:NADPH-dependent F420 reductase